MRRNEASGAFLMARFILFNECARVSEIRFVVLNVVLMTVALLFN